MARSPDTIWARLEECVSTLNEPFRASEIVGWFRRHYPEVKESSLRAHIQSATSNVDERGTLGYRSPLITRIDHGLYRRAAPADPAPTITAPTQSTTNHQPALADDDEPERVPAPTRAPLQDPEQWHHEATVQAAVVTHLATNGWQILAVADTATKAPGIDILARRGETTVGVEVKGFPSRKYADPARAHETKPTQPSTQARVWYASALLSALRLRTRHPDYLSVIALPDFPTYRNLYADTSSSLDSCQVQVWWVTQGGDVVVQTAPQAPAEQ